MMMVMMMRLIPYSKNETKYEETQSGVGSLANSLWMASRYD